MTNFKLMIVCPYFYPRVGGLENYVLNTIRFLVRDYDIDVVVVCSNWGDNCYIEEYVQSIKVYRIPYLLKVSSTPINIFWKGKLSSIIDRENPDIINGHLPVPYIADVAARIANKKNIPYILTYHNDLIGYNPIVKSLSKCYYRFIGNKTFDLSKKIIVTSDYIASSSYLKKNIHKLEIVSPGVDISKYKTLDNIQKDRNTVLFVGQLNKESQHKGLCYLLEAIKMIKNNLPEIRLVVIGEGNYIDHYKNLVTSTGLTCEVEFTGFVKEEELPNYYNKCSILVLPSYNDAEGFGMVLIEAQACGTPVIGTTVGGIPYAIKNGETGILVPPKDPKELASAILKIVTDKNLSKEMGKKGYERILKGFTWKISTDKTFKILNDVIKEHRSR